MNTPADHLRQSSLASAQALRIMSRIGWTALAVWSVILIVWGIVQPDPYDSGWRLVVENLFMGRLVSIADGIANDFSHGYLFFQTGLQDVFLLLIVFPWIVASYRGARHRGFIGATVERLRLAAERNKHVVEPFGALGLWVFVFFPFWSTGVLVGAVVGFLLGLRTRIVLASVLTAHVISVALLVWAFDTVGAIQSSINSSSVKYLPWFAVLLLITVFLLGKLYHYWKNRNVTPDHEP